MQNQPLGTSSKSTSWKGSDGLGLVMIGSRGCEGSPARTCSLQYTFQCPGQCQANRRSAEPCPLTSLATHTYFFLEGGVAEIRMVTIASFLEIIAILGQDSGRANEITDPAKVM